MTGRVRTVLGDVEPSSLGMTLVHEHLVVDWGELQGRPKLALRLRDDGRIDRRPAAGRGGRRDRGPRRVHADRDRALCRSHGRRLAPQRRGHRRGNGLLPRGLDACSPDRARARSRRAHRPVHPGADRGDGFDDGSRRADQVRHRRRANRRDRGQAAAGHGTSPPGDRRADRGPHHRFARGRAARHLRVGGRRSRARLHQPRRAAARTGRGGCSARCGAARTSAST